MPSRKHEPFEIVPIKSLDVYREVVDRIRALIASQSLGVGDRLPSERALAEALGVSRVSVRQAIKVLENMGVLESRLGSGTYVKELSVDAVVNIMLERLPLDEQLQDELVDARAAIEQRVLALAFERRATPAFRAVHEAMAARERRLLDATDEEIGSIDMYFERALAEVCGNRVLTLMQATVHEMWILTWGKLGMLPGEKHKLHDEHKTILAAIEAGDVTLAHELMAHHLDRPIERYRSPGHSSQSPTR
jgi:GntR family transcriptional repressor for pyruvate dehydrogenase complex